MNPMDWLKAAYEALGTPHPKLSMIVVLVLGAMLGAIAFGTVWQIAARQVEKNLPTATPTSGPASTTGAESPANTGNGNQFTYGQPPKEQKPSDKGKP